MEPDQLLDLSLPEIETSRTVQQDVEGTEDGQLEETESAQIGEQGISVQTETEKSIVQKIIANPQLPILGLTRIEEPPTVEKPLPTLRLVKLSTILANPRQIRSKEDDKNIMDISEEEENHDESQNPNNTTAKKTSTGSHSPQYAVQRPKKRKKKIKYTSAQVNLMLSKSNSSSNTSVEITPDTPSPSNQVQREGKRYNIQAPPTREEIQKLISKNAASTRNMEESQQQSAATATATGEQTQGSGEPQHSIIIHLPPISMTNTTVTPATTPVQPKQMPEPQQQVPTQQTNINQQEQRSQQQGTSLTTQVPNCDVRAALVRPHILNQNVTWKVKDGENLVTDYWTVNLKEILQKVKAKMTLTPQEVNYFHNFSSFLYEKYTTLWQKVRAVDMSLSDEDPCELSRRILGMPYPRWTCSACNVEHPGGTICTSRKANGPRLPINLSHSITWRIKAKAVIIGAEALFYQPPQGREEFINLSDLPNKTYPVVYTGVPLNVQEEGKGSLYQTIFNKLIHLGSNSGLPVYVEFYRNPQQTQASDFTHLCGFLRVLQAIQKIYLSPIICIVGPSIPDPATTRGAYEQRKLRTEMLHRAADKLSWAMGVPVFNLVVQVLPPYHNEYHLRAPNWSSEPLFSESGVTKEFHNRIYYEMIQFQKNLGPCLLTREEINKMERDRTP